MRDEKKAGLMVGKGMEVRSTPRLASRSMRASPRGSMSWMGERLGVWDSERASGEGGWGEMTRPREAWWW